MKKLAIILALLLIPTLCFAGSVQEMHKAVIAKKNVVAPSYLFSEDFESGSGAWTAMETPTADWNYATSPAPLAGTKSLLLGPNDAGWEGYKATFAAQNTIYFYFIVNAKALVSGNSVLYFGNGGDGFFDVENAGYEFRIKVGTVTAYSTTWTQGTTYHVWGDYTKGTGTNDVAHLYHNTSATKPEKPNITIENGDAASQISDVRLIHQYTTAETIYDKLRISTSNIGSNPE